MVTGNCQNLPRGGKLRQAIKALPGYKIVAADLSNIELRLGLYMAMQDDKIDLIRAGRDLYMDIGVPIFGKTYEEIEALGKKSRERTTGKVVQLSSIYGTGAKKLRSTLRIQGKVKFTDQETQVMTDLYRGDYMAVVQAWSDGKDVLDDLYHGNDHGDFLRPGILRVDKEGIWKPSGLLLAYPDLRWTKDPKDGKMGYTYEQKRKTRDRVYSSRVFQRCIQSLARDIICEHMLKIDKRYLVVGTVHDEIICLVAEDEVEDAEKFMLQVMRTPPAWAPDLPLDAGVSSGDNYSEAK
jgi:DNA polymerase